MPPPQVKPLTRSSVARVGTATAITAVCGYAVLYLAARDLDPAGFSVFAVFWGAFGLVTGAANGLLQESAREVRLARAAATPPAPGRRTSPLLVAAGVGVVAAAALAGTAALWSGPVFTSYRALSVGLLSAGVGAFCLHATLLGMLAGLGRWTHYGALMVADAATRVAVAAVTFAAGFGLAGYLWATVAGSAAWLVLLTATPGGRSALRLHTPGRPAAFLHGAAHSVVAAGASAILVMGFPVLLQATYGELGTEGGVLVLAVTLTRAPLLVPLTAMQGNLITHFVDQQSHRLRALATPAALVSGIGGIGVAGAGLIGPWLLHTVFGPAYVASGTLLAWLTAGAVAIALLTLTGAATVAAALHRVYALGWVVATVVAALLLLLPLELSTRAVVALLIGPLIGIAVHVVALRGDS